MSQNEPIGHSSVKTSEATTEKSRLIIDNAYDAFIEIDINSIIIDWNVQAVNTFGWSKQEAIGRDLSETIIPHQFREAHKQGIKHYQKSGEGPVLNKRIEIEALHKDGRVFPVELGIFPVRAGDTVSFCAFIHDITERKQAEKKLLSLTQELERSNAELQNFAYIAAHDLREPVRTILSYINLVNEALSGKLDVDTKENIDFVVDAAKRMQQLIADLLSYARVKTHGKPFQLVDCNNIFNQVRSALKTAIEESKATITCGNLPQFMADPNQFSQLFINLITNAIKFRRENVPVELNIAAERQSRRWVFSIQDNGIGFDMQYADRIFQMFQRLHSMDEYQGTGMGLAVCRKIVERHGGEIWVESEPGKGTTFFFSIPEEGVKS